MRLRVLEREPDAVDLCGQLRLLVPFEEAECLERRDALRRGRQLEHLDATIGEPERLNPARTIRRKVFLFEPARSAERLGDGAAVESIGPPLGERAQRGGELRLDDAVATARRRRELRRN